MEVVEIREGNINIESEEEEDETDDPQHSEGHLVFVSGCSLTKQKRGKFIWRFSVVGTDLVLAGIVGLLVTLENNHLQPGGDQLCTVAGRVWVTYKPSYPC